MSFGFFIRGLTGLASKKQCIKMATNTGKKLVDLMQTTGRNLTKSDIETVFSQTLPKGFAPKVLTERAEMIPYLIKQGMSKELATAYANHPNIGAATIMNGSNKSVLYLPLLKEGQIAQNREIPLYAHELEHSLEINHRFGQILFRKLSAPILKIIKKFKPKAIDIFGNIGMKFHDFESKIQMANNTSMSYAPRFLNCNAYKEDILRLNGMDENTYIRNFKEIIKQFADSSSNCSQNRKIYKLYRKKLKLEVSAYKTEGEVQRYVSQLKEDQTAAATGTSIIYEDTIRLLRKEKRNYLKNLFSGRLTKPTVYQTDKDLLNLMDEAADKEMLRNFVTGMNYQEKEAVFTALSKNPDKLASYIDFIKAVRNSESNFSRNHLACLENLSEEALGNPNIIKIAGIGNGFPEYAYCLEKISGAAPERIADFAKIAGVQSAGGLFKYNRLATCLDHPQYETLKKIASIETPSETRGALIGDALIDISKLEPEKIDEIYVMASKGKIDECFNMLENIEKKRLKQIATKLKQQKPTPISI